MAKKIKGPEFFYPKLIKVKDPINYAYKGKFMGGMTVEDRLPGGACPDCERR
jgi:hypothetical protein